MLLNDNEYSLQTISEKTNITIENLEKLQNREWDKLKRAQAIGLLSIIEREFDVDMSAVKEDANNFYSQNQEEEPLRTIDLVDSQSNGAGGSRIVSNIVTILTLGAIAYASWYYFINSKDNNSVTQDEQNSSGMFTNTINSVKNLLGSSDANSSNKEDAKNVVKESEKETTNSQNTTEVKQNNSTTTTKEPENKKFDITTVPADTNTANSTNQEQVAKSASLDTSAQNNNETTKEASKEESNKSVKSEVDKLLSELDANNSNSKKDDNASSSIEESLNTDTATASSEDTNIFDTNNSEEDNATTAPAITNIDIKVKSKRLWLGIYNLTNGKKINKIAKGKFSLNVGNDKFAIITGHNRFEIVTDNGVKKFAKKGKVYFTVSKDGIEEITKQEYKTLTKRRAW
jgi:hypothetical protein